MKKTIHITEAFKKGWELFRERPWFLMGALVIVMAVSVVMGFFVEQLEGGLYALANVVDVIFQTFIGMGLTAILLQVYDKQEVHYRDWFARKERFVQYLFATVLMMLAVVGGLILLIIPGIIAMVALMFATYLVLDRNMGAVAAIQASWAMTKGVRFKLFGFILVAAVVNILGVLALGVGVLVSAPVSALAAIHVYRQLLSAHA